MIPIRTAGSIKTPSFSVAPSTSTAAAAMMLYIAAVYVPMNLLNFCYVPYKMIKLSILIILLSVKMEHPLGTMNRKWNI
jgi:hypothetical protein